MVSGTTGEIEQPARSVPAGTVLFREGDPGDEMYVIRSGRIALSRRVRDRDHHLVTLGQGEVFGELAILNQEPRSATAAVLEDAELIVFNAARLETMIRNSSEIAIRLLRKLAARLAQANRQVELLLRADVTHRVAHYLKSRAEACGLPDEFGLRIDESVEDVANGAGVGVKDALECLDRLTKANLIHSHLGAIWVPQEGKLMDFVEFLEMRGRAGV